MVSQQLDFGVFAGYRLLAAPRPDQHGWLGLRVETAPARRDADGAPATAHVVLEAADRLARRRLHLEATAIQAALAEVGSPVLAGLLAHAVDSESRPVLITAPFGPSLAMELAQRGPMAVRDVLAAAKVTAAGLEALHRADLLHRALSPRALLRGPNRQVQLSSPTLPLLAERVTATPGGTGHEPPEVLAGNDWTPAAEVYALASTLWTLLAGRPPTSGSQEERLAALLHGAPPRMRRSDVPDSVATALARAMEADPAARPHSPGELMAELTRAAAEHGPATPADLQVTRPPASQGSIPGPIEGRPLGRGYWLEAKIGSGSVGTVYRARRLKDNTALAAKLLRAELADDPDSVTRFLGERTTLMRLLHPNLVKVHDLVAEGEDLAIVMDLVDGVDLRHLISTRLLDRSDALRLLSQIADALTAVHAAGIVHRDLKPENVLIAHGHTALLTDFGLARMIDRPTVTRHSEVVGTPAYLAPELATGGQVTPACDVYALGVTGYELLAGYRPFRTDNVMAALRAHIEDRPPRPPTMPDQDWALLAACLEKQPTARPTAEQLTRALAELGTSTGGSTGFGHAMTARIQATPSLAPVTSSPGRSLPPVPMPVPVPLPDRVPGEPQPTMAATRPPVVAPPEPVAPGRRRRWPLLAAVFITAVLGAVLGIWLGGPGRPGGSDRPSSQPSPTSTQSPAPLYPVSVDATVRHDGAIKLSWSTETEKLPGFQYYKVWRNDKPLDVELSSAHTEYVDFGPGPDPCYRVFAVGVTPSPSAQPLSPTCPKARN
jgi:serine/threonine protein kinase